MISTCRYLVTWPHTSIQSGFVAQSVGMEHWKIPIGAGKVQLCSHYVTHSEVSFEAYSVYISTVNIHNCHNTKV